MNLFSHLSTFIYRTIITGSIEIYPKCLCQNDLEIFWPQQLN
jgi:hypothetical protein